MQRLAKHGCDIAAFDEPASIHDRHVVGETADQIEIVGHDQNGHAALLLNLAQQRQNLLLDGDVERARRFVREQHVRILRKRDRDHDALLHAARELVRIHVEPALRIGNADIVEKRDATLPHGAEVEVGADAHCLGELSADGEDRVERARRVLKHDPDLASAQVAQLGWREPVRRLPADAGWSRR